MCFYTCVHTHSISKQYFSFTIGPLNQTIQYLAHFLTSQPISLLTPRCNSKEELFCSRRTKVWIKGPFCEAAIHRSACQPAGLVQSFHSMCSLKSFLNPPRTAASPGFTRFWVSVRLHFITVTLWHRNCSCSSQRDQPPALVLPSDFWETTEAAHLGPHSSLMGGPLAPWTSSFAARAVPWQHRTGPHCLSVEAWGGACPSAPQGAPAPSKRPCCTTYIQNLALHFVTAAPLAPHLQLALSLGLSVHGGKLRDRGNLLSPPRDTCTKLFTRNSASTVLCHTARW